MAGPIADGRVVAAHHGIPTDDAEVARTMLIADLALLASLHEQIAQAEPHIGRLVPQTTYRILVSAPGGDKSASGRLHRQRRKKAIGHPPTHTLLDTTHGQLDSLIVPTLASLELLDELIDLPPEERGGFVGRHRELRTLDAIAGYPDPLVTVDIGNGLRGSAARPSAMDGWSSWRPYAAHLAGSVTAADAVRGLLGVTRQMERELRGAQVSTSNVAGAADKLVTIADAVRSDASTWDDAVRLSVARHMAESLRIASVWTSRKDALHGRISVLRWAEQLQVSRPSDPSAPFDPPAGIELADALTQLHQCTGEDETIDEAIDVARRAKEMVDGSVRVPVLHHLRSVARLVEGLDARWRWRRDACDLEEARKHLGGITQLIPASPDSVTVRMFLRHILTEYEHSKHYPNLLDAAAAADVLMRLARTDHRVDHSETMLLAAYPPLFLYKRTGDSHHLGTARHKVNAGLKASSRDHVHRPHLRMLGEEIEAYIADRDNDDARMGDAVEEMRYIAQDHSLPPDLVRRHRAALGRMLYLWFELTPTRIEALRESVELGEEELTSGDPTKTTFQHARRLALLGLEDDDHEVLRRADALLSGLPPEPSALRTRADIAMHAGDPEGAVGLLRSAVNAARSQANKSDEDAESEVGRREQAAWIEGLVGDLALACVAAGSPDEAIRAIEEPRVWLATPSGAACAPDGRGPCAWVATGTSGTAVIVDGDGDCLATILSEFPRRRVNRLIADAVNDGWSLAGGRDALMDAVSRIVDHFPVTTRLLLVPVGRWAAVPFVAGRRSDGSVLVERTALTVAPTRSWARAAARPSPGGDVVVVLGPGNVKPLDLQRDNNTLAQFGAREDRSDVPDPLSVVNRDTWLLHVSSHGEYRPDDPLSSVLHIGEGVTVGRLIEARLGAWLTNLSACETAMPDTTRMEQLISFPTAFLLAGSSHVIASLWAVDNEAASIYNEAFYAALSDETAVDNAHQHAVLTVRRHNDDIGFWAPFVHVGAPG